MTYLELKDVSYRYPNGFEAIEGVSMKFDLGQAVAIIGQNGAGKTTVVKLMNGLLKPTEGQVIVDGISTKDQKTSDVASKVGYVFQNPDDQIFQDTIGGEIAYGLKKHRIEQSLITSRVHLAAELCGLLDVLNTHPYNLPFSQRKFVTIASAIAMDPQILVLDEPTAGQDLVSTQRLAGIVKFMVNAGKTVIAITHDMEFVAEEFARSIVMANKRVVMDDSTRRVFDDDKVLQEASLKRPYIAQLAEARRVRGVLTVEDMLDRDVSQD